MKPPTVATIAGASEVDNAIAALVLDLAPIPWRLDA
jgi:hypothetical protein